LFRQIFSDEKKILQKNFQKHLREKLPGFFAENPCRSRKTSGSSSTVQNVAKFLSSTSPSGADDKNDQHYVDDLRAGAFQYVEANHSDQMKPYQVIFIVRQVQDRDEAGQLQNCYPQ
jgi:hypothetical protein